MRYVYSAIVLTSAIGLASAAHAADVAAPASDWTGFYVGFGAGGGYGVSDMSAAGAGAYEDYSIDGIDYSDLNSPNFKGNFLCDAGRCDGFTSVFGALDGDTGTAGFLGRAEIGADYQFDRIVAGVNGSFTFGDRTISASGGGGGNASYSDNAGADQDGEGLGGVDSDLELGNSWGIGARLGYLVSDNVLLFGTAGYTQAQTELSAHFKGEGGAQDDPGSSISGAYDISSSNNEWLGGYYLGAGLETLVTNEVALKVEYRYADYGSIKTSSEASDITCEGQNCYGWETGVEAEADVTDHSVMATVSFRM